MTCCCECSKEKALDKLMRLEPEKTSELTAFIDGLPLVAGDVEKNRGFW